MTDGAVHDDDRVTPVVGAPAADRSLGLLGRVAVAANEADDVQTAADEVVALLGRYVDADAATCWFRDRDGALMPIGAWYLGASAPPGLPAAVQRGVPVGFGTLPGRVDASRAPVWLVGLRGRDHWLAGRGDGDLGIRTAFAVPVWSHGSVVGVAAAFCRDERPVDLELLELLEQVATQLGAVHRRCARSAAPPAGEGPATVEPPSVPASWLGGGRGHAVDPAAIAHRIRTPLSGVLGPLELLVAGEDDPERRELLEVALRSARELHGVLEAGLRGGLPVAATTEAGADDAVEPPEPTDADGLDAFRDVGPDPGPAAAGRPTPSLR
ncbi:MAG: GAF domain-containing protein [Acidimicrobiales bacterium]